MLRFTTRDLLWLTVLVAVALSWLIERIASHRRAAVWESEKAAFQQKFAELKLEQASRNVVTRVIEDAAYEMGYDRGVSSERQAHERLRRGTEAMPSSRLETEAGIYVRGPGSLGPAAGRP